MRPLATLALVLMLVGAGLAFLPAIGPEPDATEQALSALDASGWRSPESLLAFRVHGWGADAHWSRSVDALDVAAADGDPATGLRAIHALYTGEPRPVGAMHEALVARLQDNVPRVLNSSNDAVVSFQILAMAAAGEPVGGLTDHLTALAIPHDAGHAWGCGGPPSLECTAFAMWALTTVGTDDAWTAPATAFILEHYADGPFDDPILGPSVQATAWSVLALRQVGAPTLDATTWLADQQDASGLYLHGGRPDRWATADVLLMQGL